MAKEWKGGLKTYQFKKFGKYYAYDMEFQTIEEENAYIDSMLDKSYSFVGQTPY